MGVSGMNVAEPPSTLLDVPAMRQADDRELGQIGSMRAAARSSSCFAVVSRYLPTRLPVIKDVTIPAFIDR
jgi:hypothetical protein